MNEKIKINKKWILCAAGLFLVFLITGIFIWKDYRDTLMDNQIDQLRITTRILSKNMETSIKEYEDDLDFLESLAADEVEEIFQKYEQTKDSYGIDLYWEDEQGNFLKSISGGTYEELVEIAKIDESREIYQMNTNDDHRGKYLVVKKKRAEGGKICLVVDEEKYYQRIISNIKIGSNGYIVIKSSDGRILMHPDDEQWGIDVIEGRKEMFPDLDFSSLTEMIENQKKGEEGVSVYYSYWWTKEDLPRVKKISVYTPAKIGNDFFVISSVTDYEDFFQPIREGFTGLLLLFAGILVVTMLLFFFAMKMVHKRRQVEAENTYLKELNELLEEVHQNEETIAHQQRLQIMGTMTGGIAHEFNNFLTPIMGYAELLMMELPEDSEEYENVVEIYEASEKARDVVRQISTLSRKNVETVYKEVDAAQMIRRAVKMVESVCPANVQMESEIQLEGQSILGNTTQLHQVILNICVNAVHAIGKKKKGKIQIMGQSISYENLNAELQKKVNSAWQQYLVIRIQDNGCGMDSETLRQIFNPFFTTKKGGEGTGLGLALAEQIITSHKGYLYAESEKGLGSTFSILLPVMEKGEKPAIMREKKPEQLRIIAADDNQKILKLLERHFAKLGVHLKTCGTKQEILEFLKQGDTDALVIDESIEDVSGIDFCMSIQGTCPDLKKILMVNHVTREVAEAKSRNIIDGYVEKPVSAASLLEALR